MEFTRLEALAPRRDVQVPDKISVLPRRYCKSHKAQELKDTAIATLSNLDARLSGWKFRVSTASVFYISGGAPSQSRYISCGTSNILHLLLASERFWGSSTPVSSDLSLDTHTYGTTRCAR